jgi:hypothetical protein
VDEAALKQASFELLLFFPGNHHSTVTPYSSVSTLMRCAIALTRQHIITSSVFQFEVSDAALEWSQSSFCL